MAGGQAYLPQRIVWVNMYTCHPRGFVSKSLSSTAPPGGHFHCVLAGHRLVSWDLAEGDWVKITDFTPKFCYRNYSGTSRHVCQYPGMDDRHIKTVGESEARTLYIYRFHSIQHIIAWPFAEHDCLYMHSDTQRALLEIYKAIWAESSAVEWQIREPVKVLISFHPFTSFTTGYKVTSYQVTFLALGTRQTPKNDIHQISTVCTVTSTSFLMWWLNFHGVI